MIDLKRFREENNIKQKELATILGIPQPYISAIERGERPLNFEKYKKLLAHYGDLINDYKHSSTTSDLEFQIKILKEALRDKQEIINLLKLENERLKRDLGKERRQMGDNPGDEGKKASA